MHSIINKALGSQFLLKALVSYDDQLFLYLVNKISSYIKLQIQF